MSPRGGVGEGPLVGKRVVVTRAVEQAEDLASLLEQRGAVAIRCPTVRLAPPEDRSAIAAALARLDDFDWIVFTSANGVRFTLAEASGDGSVAVALSRRRVAAVGAVTAEALAAAGVQTAFVGPGDGGRALAEALDHVTGCSVLLLRSDRADPVVGEVLRRRGARKVAEVVAYRTLPVAPEGRGLAELRRGVDALTFTSPSTVQGLQLLEEWRGLVEGAIIATLGPTTSAAARGSGLEVHVEAVERSMGGLVEVLALGFEHPSAGR